MKQNYQIPAERHRRIRELVAAAIVARVADLSAALGVSEVTIRRDLELLERRGVIERTHGGAVLSQRMRDEPDYSASVQTRLAEKQRIGQAAAALIAPGDTIFVNSGSTTLQAVQQLKPGADVAIVTTSLDVALAARERRLRLTLLGGVQRPRSNGLVGPLTIGALERLFADKALIGLEGVSARFGLTMGSAEEAEIARMMIERSRGGAYVLADRSKFGIVADFAVAPLEDVAAWVVDGPEAAAYVGLGIRVVVA
jgi:DeoR family fructose operon transcriptional repressor